ncbi:hypothetical protein Ahy_B06g084719 [Arachis hypogaea]|uniref:Uncharacterized protein n=1 Tax=Arachis hypogaea TaxID=3818 RepID=A0A444YSK8_ARAHY|nr:hypothetical protein Ahy_B06g084719 [Arachis hypogaea]
MIKEGVCCSQEVQAMERGIPLDLIQFSSKLEIIKSNPDRETLLELEYGSKLLAKILISYDGIRSSIAKWMGFLRQITLVIVLSVDLLLIQKDSLMDQE